MESLVFRNYVILNVRFSVLSFLKSLGCDTEEMEPENTEEILAESGKNIESAITYAKKMISQAITIRDQNSGNKNRSILKTAVDFIDEHYMDEDISDYSSYEQGEGTFTLHWHAFKRGCRRSRI